MQQEKNFLSNYTKTYTTFSGVDIDMVIDSWLVGTAQGCSYSITREKAPVYVMGSVDPVSFSRGKRGIAGSMIYFVFDRHSLSKLMENSKFAMKETSYGVLAGGKAQFVGNWGRSSGYLGMKLATPNYADQIPPFDIVLTARNEYGQARAMAIWGVEILNEGAGMSVDDMVQETQMTYVARAITFWQPVDEYIQDDGSITGEFTSLEELRNNTRSWQQTGGGE